MSEAADQVRSVSSRDEVRWLAAWLAGWLAAWQAVPDRETAAVLRTTYTGPGKRPVLIWLDAARLQPSRIVKHQWGTLFD